ncbi:hypothetical protein IM876_06205 [Serratia plymuthica]|uniref:hypothetical protein n=1 Tax=Serratia plymuthica TaxID=82996 RepID=UPI0019260E8E|nr:hypothetical protein [Serratia plymuthica]MBL3522248.1 hypothetical protein [Serratia plymuthica]
MFSPSNYEFMTNNMKIIVESIESKLNEDFFMEYKLIAIDAIGKYIEEIERVESSGVGSDLSRDNEAEEFIRSHYCDIVESINDDKVIQVFDALRIAFTHYSCGGLYQLYTHQENGDWYPEIILTEILTPNDIDSLNEMLTLYRGCDISELESKNFRQAWTTSLNVAERFAYDNYLGYDGFDVNKRVVLETTYPRNYVLFSKQSVEYEVVINTSMLGCVRKYS